MKTALFWILIIYYIQRDSKQGRFRQKTPDAGFEPATNGLTVRCSTAELIRNRLVNKILNRRYFRKNFYEESEIDLSAVNYLV